ncbi:hypothetical protein KIN20_033889 [Parelaphostrongylus tenuis]|uniref:Uncharacterized protein n=1 Tax=Parelaphostrongylus tenuis TaxID=148309 RepID=A0AAD5R985_PARTN|nr:hypothetical protein KIN20_033889 [Parelaphostrongylus tenuis]
MTGVIVERDITMSYTEEQTSAGLVARAITDIVTTSSQHHLQLSLQLIGVKNPTELVSSLERALEHFLSYDECVSSQMARNMEVNRLFNSHFSSSLPLEENSTHGTFLTQSDAGDFSSAEDDISSTVSVSAAATQQSNAGDFPSAEEDISSARIVSAALEQSNAGDFSSAEDDVSSTGFVSAATQQSDAGDFSSNEEDSGIAIVSAVVEQDDLFNSPRANEVHLNEELFSPEPNSSSSTKDDVLNCRLPVGDESSNNESEGDSPSLMPPVIKRFSRSLTLSKKAKAFTFVQSFLDNNTSREDITNDEFSD